MLVAPILAVMAYFATDHFVGEKPHKAIEGQQYPLVAKSNCRYASGLCTLQNGELKLKLSATDGDNGILGLQLESNYALQGAKIALSYEGMDGQPEEMLNKDSKGQAWSIKLPDNTRQTEQLRLVVLAQNSVYFAETGMLFMEKENGFSR